MIIGKLDRRITIQNFSSVIASSGQRIKTWSTHLTVWANAMQKMGKETTEDDNRSTSRMVEFKVRWNSTITNQMRIIWEDNYYKIEDIEELGRKDGLLISTSLLTQT